MKNLPRILTNATIIFSILEIVQVVLSMPNIIMTYRLLGLNLIFTVLIVEELIAIVIFVILVIICRKEILQLAKLPENQY